MADAPQADVERLYGLDLDEFIPARDATARRLRGDGRREEADLVKALRKPSNPAWVVNRLARAEPKVVGELLAAGGRLRDVQLGGAAGGDLRKAMDDERRALDRAMRNAEEIATHAKLASRVTLDRVRETLHLAALDPGVGAEVEQGVLVKEGRATGFTDLAVFAPSPAPSRKAAPEKPAAKASPAADARKAAAAERAAAREQERREKAVAKACNRLAAAEKQLAAAERDAEAARAALEKAERRAVKARGVRDDAQAQLAELEG
jgi:hypothetical protein